MPRDLEPPSARRRIVMPWAGHNAAIMVRRAAPPKLPPHWGASFSRKLHRPGHAAAAAPALEPRITGATLAERLLALLERLATHGSELPGTTRLAELLDVPWEQLTQVNRAFARLAEQGLIAQWHDNARYFGERIVRLIATGAELRTAGAPQKMRLA